MTVRTEWRRLREDFDELIERHSTARDLNDFEQYADDPVGFIRDVLGDQPWSRQVEMAESVLKHPLVVVRSANAVGKDWAVSPPDRGEAGRERGDPVILCGGKVAKTSRGRASGRFGAR